MMKVSDPVIFGHAVRVFFKDLFTKYETTVFKEIGFNPNNGLQDLYDKMKLLPEVTRKQILDDIEEVYERRPWLAMVNSDKVSEGRAACSMQRKAHSSPIIPSHI